MKLLLALGLALLSVSVSADCSATGFPALWTTFQTACGLDASATTSVQIWEYRTVLLASNVESESYPTECYNAADAVKACGSDATASAADMELANNVTQAYDEGTGRNDVSYAYAIESVKTNCWGCNNATAFASVSCKLSTCYSYYGNQKCYYSMNFLGSSYVTTNNATVSQEWLDMAYDRKDVECDEFDTYTSTYADRASCTGDALTASVAWYNAACMTDDNACNVMDNSNDYNDCRAAFYHLYSSCVDYSALSNDPDTTNSADARRLYYLYYQCSYPSQCRDAVVGPQLVALAAATSVSFSDSSFYSNVAADPTGVYAAFCALVYSPVSTLGAQLANIYTCYDDGHYYYGAWSNQITNIGYAIYYDSCPAPKYCDTTTVTTYIALAATYNMSAVCGAHNTYTGESGNIPAELNTAVGALYDCYWKEDSEDTDTTRKTSLETFYTSLSNCGEYYQYCSNQEVYDRLSDVVAACPGCTYSDLSNSACQSNTSFCATSSDNYDCNWAAYYLSGCSSSIGDLADQHAFLTMVKGLYTACTPVDCDPGYAQTGPYRTCEICPAGTYSWGYQQTYCYECGSSMTSPEGSDSYSDCVSMYDSCPAGQANIGEDFACAACPKGTYASGSGNTACTDCPEGETTQSTGSDSWSDCMVPLPACSEEEIMANAANISIFCNMDQANPLRMGITICSATFPDDWFGLNNNASAMCRWYVNAQSNCVSAGADLYDFAAWTWWSTCSAFTQCWASEVDAALAVVCSDSEICDAINWRAADDECQSAVSTLTNCVASDRGDNGATSATLQAWGEAHNQQTCPYCKNIGYMFTDALNSCGCAVDQNAADRADCTAQVCDTFYNWPNSAEHTQGSVGCLLAGHELMRCDGDPSTSPADQTKISQLLAIGTPQNCQFVPDCSEERVYDMINTVNEECACNMSSASFDIFSCFDNLCSSSDCQSAVRDLSWCMVPPAPGSPPPQADNLNHTVAMIVDQSYATMAACPLDGGSCDATTVNSALLAFQGSSCGCGDLLAIFALNDTAFAKAQEPGPNGADSMLVAAHKKCAAGVCNPGAVACQDAVHTMARCYYPLSWAQGGLLDVAKMVVDSCPAGSVDPYPTCNQMHRDQYFRDYASACQCSMQNPRDPTCHQNLCGRDSCQRAVTKLYTCLPFANFTESMMIQAIATNQANCQNPNFDPNTCTGAGLQATMGAFIQACPACKVQDPAFNPATCSAAICNEDSHTCHNAYMKVAECFGLTDPAEAPMVGAVLPFGQYCDVAPEECQGRAADQELAELFMTCGCTDGTSCLALATACEFSGACLASAVNLMAKCGNHVQGDYQAIFTQAGTALNACNQPKCDKTTFHMVDPLMPGQQGKDCCFEHSGAHGVDGACCLRNEAVTDVKQPDAYIDTSDNNTPCCFVNADGSKVGTCKLEDDSSSTVVAGVATIIATLVALLL